MVVRPTVKVFRSSIFQLSLKADSRSYVLFSLERRESDENEVYVPSSLSTCSCEYLPDLHQVCADSIKWIIANCESIKAEDGRHLYWKFK
jgi:hypothetical protein